VPLFGADFEREARAILFEYTNVAKAATDDMWRRKLGLTEWSEVAQGLLTDLFPLLESSDYTIFWRQLAEVPIAGLSGASSDEELVSPLERALYTDGSPKKASELRVSLAAWLRRWLAELPADGAAVGAAMKRESPKYVPREFMLVEAYSTAARTGDYTLVRELHELFTKPFDEQPEYEERYYQKTPVEKLTEAGTAFMS